MTTIHRQRFEATITSFAVAFLLGGYGLGRVAASSPRTGRTRTRINIFVVTLAVTFSGVVFPLIWKNKNLTEGENTYLIPLLSACVACAILAAMVTDYVLKPPRSS